MRREQLVGKTRIVVDTPDAFPIPGPPRGRWGPTPAPRDASRLPRRGLFWFTSRPSGPSAPNRSSQWKPSAPNVAQLSTMRLELDDAGRPFCRTGHGWSGTRACRQVRPSRLEKTEEIPLGDLPALPWRLGGASPRVSRLKMRAFHDPLFAELSKVRNGFRHEAMNAKYTKSRYCQECAEKSVRRSHRPPRHAILSDPNSPVSENEKSPPFREDFRWGHIVEVVRTAIANMPPCSYIPNCQKV